MKVSALQEYALRCLLQLAKNVEERPMSAEEISSKELLSPAYIEKILQRLTKAGFVKSIRGTKGGYIITRAPEEISVGHVIRAVEGASMNDLCTHFSGNSPECTHISGCGIRPLWTNIYKYIYDVLDRTSLYDLMKEEATTAMVIEANFIRSLEEMTAK